MAGLSGQLDTRNRVESQPAVATATPPRRISQNAGLSGQLDRRNRVENQPAGVATAKPPRRVSQNAVVCLDSWTGGTRQSTVR